LYLLTPLKTVQRHHSAPILFYATYL